MDEEVLPSKVYITKKFNEPLKTWKELNHKNITVNCAAKEKIFPVA